jgi:hypothetical protein
VQGPTNLAPFLVFIAKMEGGQGKELLVDGAFKALPKQHIGGNKRTMRVSESAVAIIQGEMRGAADAAKNNVANDERVLCFFFLPEKKERSFTPQNLMISHEWGTHDT